MKHQHKLGKAILIGLVLGAGALSVEAQQQGAPADVQSALPNPQLKLSPQKQLENFEPPIDEEYTLGAGDEITLNFPGRPELSGKYILGPDGRITLPMAGPLVIANQTRENASKTIVSALSPFYTNLTVTVSIDKYGSNHVIVLGNVAKPGMVNFDTTPTLLDAISRAGLVSTPTNKDGIPDQCMIYRGNNQQLTINLREMLHNGTLMGDMRLRRNDIVFIPSQLDRYVSVMGEVEHPGAVPLTPDADLASILAQAGGLGPNAGSSPKITIIQKSNGATRTIAYNELMTPKGLSEVSLKPGDIVVVPKSGFSKVSLVLQKLSPITSLATVATLATGVP